MKIIQDRRALHRIPELELDLPETMAYLKNALTGLKCTVFSPMPGALAAFFDFGASHAIAFRADCDGLPIQEKTDVPYASCHKGRMHACGHDGHMAIALELARGLDSLDSLHHNVLLLFQPGEESPGGAEPLCRTGVLEQYNVKAIFGLHLWPGLEQGVVFSRKGGLMSRASELNVDIHGRSAHIAKAGEALDALRAGLRFYDRMLRLEQSLPRETYRLLNCGKMTSGTVRNAISAHTRLEGSLRAFEDEVFEGLQVGLQEIAAEVEKETGCTVKISYSEGYRAVWNPAELYDRVKALVPFRDLAEPTMTSEDFSAYQRRVPGLFFFLGLGTVPPLHSDDFHFDEQILTKGADFFLELAKKYR